MALGLIAEDSNARKILIFIDNRPAILFSKQPKQQSGWYLLQELALRIETLPSQLVIHWISAYSGVSVNEAVDMAAKEATGWREKWPPKLPFPIPSHLHTLNSAYRTATGERARAKWAQNRKDGNTDEQRLNLRLNLLPLSWMNSTTWHEQKVDSSTKNGQQKLASALTLDRSRRIKEAPLRKKNRNLCNILFCVARNFKS